MNFVSAKDLRKVPNKKVTSVGSSNATRPGIGGKCASEDIVAAARHDRDQRLVLRTQTITAVKIQAWWRCRNKYRQIALLQVNLLDKKMSDIEKVAAVLIRTSVVLVPPITVCVDLAKMLTFRGKLDPVRTVKFCNVILQQTLSQLEPAKNAITELFSRKYENLMSNLMFTLIGTMTPACSRKHVITTQNRDLILAPTLLLLLGGGEPIKMKYCESVACSFRRVRDFYYRQNIFQRIRGLLSEWAQVSLDTCGDKYDQKISSTPSENCMSDVLIACCMFLVTVDEDVLHDRLVQFARLLMTVPALTSLLSPCQLFKLTNWTCFGDLVTLLQGDVKLPVSGHAVIHSGQWLLGNCCALAPHMVISSKLGNGTESISSPALSAWLSLCSSLLQRWPVAGVLTGTSGVLWTRVGASLSASGVPSLLSEQILCVLAASVTRGLSERVLSGFLVDDLACLAVAEDAESVRSALSLATGMSIASSTLQETLEASSWFSSKWAQSIVSSMAKSIGLSSLSPSSSASRARGTANCHSRLSANEVSHLLSQDFDLVTSLCELWAVVLPSAVTASTDSVIWRSLSSLAFSSNIVVNLWVAILCLCKRKLIGDSELCAGRLDDATALPQFLVISSKGVPSVLVTLMAVLRLVLVTMDDSELYDRGVPLPLHQYLPMIRCLKVILFNALAQDPTVMTISPTQFECIATRSVAAVLTDLYCRWSRKPFCLSAVWEVEQANSSAMRSEFRSRSPFAAALLRSMPWAMNFTERLKMVRAAVDDEKLAVQGSNDPFTAQRKRGIPIRIRRVRILEEGMAALDQICESNSASIKDRFVIQYINDFGETEAGIDVGGLFKDFLCDLSNRIFDPSYGLFSSTSTNLLYPNPAAVSLYGQADAERLYIFVGRILGKAIFENITLQPQFAHFFLAFMHGRYNFMNLINDLNTLDPELYKNLMFLKSYEGDIEDLCLTFSVADTSLGTNLEHELFPGSLQLAVTSSNRLRYINCMAKYYLYDRLKLQSRAFFKGLYEVINPDMMTIFCAPELQVLISGDASGGVDIEDFKRNVHYAAGYTVLDKRISWFWSIVGEMTQQDRAFLVKFVTSCERPPSLGFGALQPSFTIQRVDCSDDSRLPTASTCFNILKLPTYSSKGILEAKLLTSIRSKSGFDLS